MALSDMTGLHPMMRGRRRLTLTSGWRRSAICFLLGVCTAFSLPPFHLLPMAVIGYSGICWIFVSSYKGRHAFFGGWWFGLGHFTSGLYWMCIALLVDPARFGWLIPFTLIGLNGLIAISLAICGYIIWYFRETTGEGIRMAIFFAAILTLTEWLRGHLYTGFPWNLAGYAWSQSDELIQSASLIGIYGLSFFTLLAAVMPAALAHNRLYGFVGLLWAWGFLIILGAYGNDRLKIADREGYAEIFQPGVILRLVQGNISQHHKWDPKLQFSGMQRYLELSTPKEGESFSHVIWPETAIPYALNSSPSLMNLLSTIVPHEGALLSGVLRTKGSGDSFQIWNSLAAIDEAGNVIEYYDKHHLVPFGEFVPLRSMLPSSVKKITAGASDFSRGSGPTTLNVGILPNFSPLICYESIFAANVVPLNKKDETEWLLNITNDAWFGYSTGPYQHYQMARMRAIEEGLPLVRVANTGITAMIDAYGREVKKMKLGETGYIDTPLPFPIKERTVYSRFGDKPVQILILIIIVLSCVGNYKRSLKI